MPLPDLSGVGSHGKEFAAEVRRLVLVPLCVPVKVVMLVTPPGQGNDLDNLALTALPTVQRTFPSSAIMTYEDIER
ncbi:hypothetical protein [Amycolatopsis sp. CFH S0078]|uniref:hypothetical protein n=1 Tax=Amycolatopsis sp. CFH S0078 TaxID=1644108 RepID=UPI00196A3622|nr:hypothetical protein [Amycolatopsis sp. CFH S0078]